MKYKILVVSGETSFDEDFTSDEIMDSSIDSLEADSIEEILHLLINGINDMELSDMNWYFLYEISGENMTMISKLPNGITG